jgi:hypothetical protein
MTAPGQGNKIAVFDTWVQGICAQLDLWRTSANYKNKRFADAIAIWSGHNNVPSYIAYVKARVPGITENTIMNDAFWNSPMGIQFLKAQAGHEAGKAIPAPDADWIEAQRRVFGGVAPAKPAVVKETAKAGAAAAGGAVVVAGAAKAVERGWGFSEFALLAVGLVVAAGLAYVGWRMWKKYKAEPAPYHDVLLDNAPAALPSPATVWITGTGGAGGGAGGGGIGAPAKVAPKKPRAPRKPAAKPKAKKNPVKRKAA